MPRIRIKPQSLAEAKYKWERDKLWAENEELRAENARLKEEFESKLAALLAPTKITSPYGWSPESNLKEKIKRSLRVELGATE